MEEGAIVAAVKRAAAAAATSVRAGGPPRAGGKVPAMYNEEDFANVGAIAHLL